MSRGGRSASPFLPILALLVCATALSAVSREEDAVDFHEVVSAPEFAARRAAYVSHIAESEGGGTFAQLVRMAAGRAPDWRPIERSLDKIDHRHDCADFDLHGLLRLLYQFSGSPGLSSEQWDRIRRTVLGFKYWPDEPGVDSMCTWSENHHILFASAGYLAGQRYPDAVFTNSGKTGRDQMAVMRPRVMRWLELRFRTGFSEWLSNVYYDEDLVALLNLVDFCDDEEIATRAAMVLDLLCADIALNSFRGVFGGTHGRTYENERKYARHENTTATQYLLFGRGAAHAGGISAPCLALSERYRPPRVLFEIANDLHARDTEIRQRMGIRVRDAARWGLGFKSVEDGMTWLSLEAYAHPLTINLFVDMLDAFNWWENAFFEDAKAFRRLLGFCRNWRVLPLVALFFRHDVCRNTREEVNIYTYRTPDYMLSTAQDYRKGYGGDQQHIWQATLGPDAVCFTSHPARRHGRSPNYWTGYGTLPRAAQIENVVIEIYNVARKPSLYVANELFFTHAWLPRDRFEECIERDGWVFARRGDGYLAFYSQHPYRWQTERGDDQDREMIVDSPRNVFICEMGRRATDGEFTEFVRRILDAPVVIDGLRVTYQSPSQGHIAWDWTGPLLHNGAPVELREYPRYDSPYGRVAFPNDAAVFRCNGHWLELEWAAARREASAFLEP